jgi:hypothetical protein
MKTSKSLPAARHNDARSRIYAGLYWLLALSFGSFWSLPAQAEYCWMIGCAGDVGYVYVPGSQLGLKAGVTSTNLNGEEYRLDSSGRLFREYGLPDVGSIVTLKNESALLPYESLSNTSLEHEIRKFSYVFDMENRTASLYVYKLGDFGNPMRPGARLKILSYLGDGSGGNSNLFALVSVVSD